MRYKPRTSAFLASVLLLFALPAAPLRAEPPDEIRARIEAAGDADRYPGSDRVLIFDRTEADVRESGLTVKTRTRLWKVLRPSGALALRSVVEDYDPQSGLVEVAEAKIYRKGGTVEPLSIDRVFDYPAPARGIYWGLRQVMLAAGRLEPGDALLVTTYRKGFTYALLGNDASAGASAAQGQNDDERFAPPMRGHMYDIVEFWDAIPVLERTYTAVLPADKPLQYEVYNGEVTSSVHFRDGKIAYTWAKRDIEPFHGEPDMVATSDVATKLLLSTSPDWFAKSRWFYGVNEDYGSFDVTPEVRAKVEALLAGVTDDEAKVRILTHWCADFIRYSGISMGEGEGYTLHKGAMTFRDRCGVCKDKAGMLITMLRAAGFESYAAMTMAGSRIDRIPADQFNHSVTLIKLRDGLELASCPGFGNYKLLDPTWVPFMRELWSSAEQQQQYLPGVPEGADLQTTQLSPPENHYFRLVGESRLDAEGNLEGSFTLEAEGQSDAGVRWALNRRRPKALWGAYFDEVLHALSPRAECVALTFPDPYDLSRPISIRMDYRIPRYATVAGDRMLFVPPCARYPFSDTHSFLKMNVDLEERKFAFHDRTSRLVELSETVTLPEGYRLLHAPSPDAVDADAASFRGSVEEREGDPHALAFHVRLALGRRIYEASEYDPFRKAVTGLETFMKEEIVVGR